MEHKKQGRFTAKEIFSIPNIMGYFRILLIPIFCYLFFTAKTDRDYLVAAGIVLVSTITDFLDGLVARKCNMVTELGKFIDPLADKLTHGALAICLAYKYPLMLLVVGIMLIKEGFMAVMGIIKLKDGKKLDGAMWFGKVCTATLFIVMFILLLFPSLPIQVANGLILLCAAVMLFTLIMYIPVFRKM
ncbi:MAG: CDP-alcohol phosphatidyltransferase family protein [Lachnospiraceae bacterium]